MPSRFSGTAGEDVLIRRPSLLPLQPYEHAASLRVMLHPIGLQVELGLLRPWGSLKIYSAAEGLLWGPAS